MFTEQGVKRHRSVVVLGPTFVANLFGGGAFRGGSGGGAAGGGGQSPAPPGG